MFEKGDYIVYGTTGVCQIEDITTMDPLQTGTGRLTLPGYIDFAKADQ